MTLPKDREEEFLTAQGHIIHAELCFDSDPDGVVSYCHLSLDSDDHDYSDTPCSSLEFALDHDALECDDAPSGSVPIDSAILYKIKHWAEVNGY
jgi:hypothetical protein